MAKKYRRAKMVKRYKEIEREARKEIRSIR